MKIGSFKTTDGAIQFLSELWDGYTVDTLWKYISLRFAGVGLPVACCCPLSYYYRCMVDLMPICLFLFTVIPFSIILHGIIPNGVKEMIYESISLRLNRHR